LGEALALIRDFEEERRGREAHAERSVTGAPIRFEDARYLLLHCESLGSVVEEYQGWRVNVSADTVSEAGREMLVRACKWWAHLQDEFETRGLHPAHLQLPRPRSDLDVAIMALLEALFAEPLYPIVHWFVRETSRSQNPELGAWCQRMTGATARLRVLLESDDAWLAYGHESNTEPGCFDRSNVGDEAESEDYPANRLGLWHDAESRMVTRHGCPSVSLSPLESDILRRLLVADDLCCSNRELQRVWNPTAAHHLNPSDDARRQAIRCLNMKLRLVGMKAESTRHPEGEYGYRIVPRSD
jgi:hypothetical protein